MRSAVSPKHHGQTILIVDDIPANVGLLVDYLEDHGFRVVVAQDGEEGIERAQFAQPDLILLDVMMPGMDGFETCRRLKTNDSTKDIPVIFMTALADASQKVTGFGVGGVDYVTKPFQIEEVLARVNTHLSLRAMQKQLETRNLQLQQEIAIRKRTEQSLSDNYTELINSNRKLEKLHQHLLQAEKMASIGQLAAGVAHEINNPIAFVSSNLGTLQAYVAQLLHLLVLYERTESCLLDHPELLEEINRMRQILDLNHVRADLKNLLDESVDGVDRVRRIVLDLKNFSRVGEVERQIVDLHSGIDSTLNIVMSEIKQKAEVKKEYGKIPAIEAVPAQLNQVFLNLLVNAAQAIENDGAMNGAMNGVIAGVITIRTGHQEDWVWVEVEDNGRGIPDDDLTRIFDPFFTTKPVGMGTGLGLSLSYGIVAQHGGRIEVNSQIDKGSTFRIWLPVHASVMAAHE